MALVAIDLGYIGTKAKSAAREVIIPSVVGPARKLLEADMAQYNDADHIIDLDDELFVGNLALRQSSTRFFTLREEKISSDITMALFRSSLALLGDVNGSTYLVTGLPVAYFFEQKPKVETMLGRTHKIRVRLGGKLVQKIVVIQRIKQVPQPLGTAMHFLLDDHGRIKQDVMSIAKGRIGVLDIGFYTNDLLVLDALEPVSTLSRSLRSGMSVAYKAMADAGIDIPIYELDILVRKGLYRDAAHQAFAALANQIIGELETYWDSQRLDLVIITGGGGGVLHQHLKLPWKHVIIDDPVMANVRGYYKLGRRVFGL